MNSTQIALCSLMITGCSANQNPEYAASVETEDQRTFNIHIHQNITQDMGITNENNNGGNSSKNCKCADYFGTKLIECMKSLPAEKVKENFIALTAKSAHSVLQSFDTAQTTELVAYFTKEEWREWHDKLPQEIQEKISATREEAIRSAKRRALHKELIDTIKGLILL